MQILLMLAFIGLSNGYSVQQEPGGPLLPPPPLQSNPSTNTKSHGVLKNPLDPVADFERPVVGRTRASTPCDLNAISSASGDKLTSLVRDAPRQCIDGIFSFSGNSQAKDTCNEADMNTIANSFYATSYYYDAEKPNNSPGMLNFLIYMRACYFNQAYNEQVIGKYSTNLLTFVRYGIDNFFYCPNLEAQNDVHYEIAREVLTLISNAQDHINYAPMMAALLTKLGSVWKFEKSNFIQRASQGDVINAMYDNFFKSHSDEAAANAYFCANTEVPQSLNDFMDRQGSLLNTGSEWILRNTGGELGRFAKYSCISSQISSWLKRQLDTFTFSNATKVFSSIADKIVYYDYKNCASYYLCTFKADLEKKILPFTKSCNKTYIDVFKIRAQQISDDEAAEVCRRLKEQESYFHYLVKDNWQPVDLDTNALVEVIIFNNVDEYKFYAGNIFGINTNNGGMFMEGDPSKQGNIARYFCYEMPTDGKFDVWNLEHEFTHYLDGRYNTKGDFFAVTSSVYIYWWLEGFAEYAANKQQYPSMVQDCKDKSYSLSTIFNNNYSSGQVRIYDYGYLAARFMFERHRWEVDSIMDYFRSGEYSQYDSFISGISSKYDQEFSDWCTCIANGQPC